MKNLPYLILILLIGASFFLKKSYDESYNILNQNNEAKNLLIEKLLASQTKNLNLLSDKISIDSIINTSNDEFRVFFYFNSDNCWDCINQELAYLNDISFKQVKNILSFFHETSLFNFTKNKYPNLNFISLKIDRFQGRTGNKPAYLVVNRKNEVVNLFEPEYGRPDWTVKFLEEIKAFRK